MSVNLGITVITVTFLYAVMVCLSDNDFVKSALLVPAHALLHAPFPAL